MSIEVIIPNRTTSDVEVNINPDINANEQQRISNENQRIANEIARQERYDSLIDYNNQINKPKINSVELLGNKSLDDLGIQGKEAGKGLSANDFSDEYKQKVDNNTTARHTHNNISILDNISNQDIQNWNNKADTSDIPDVSSFITKFVNDLVYYYTKSDTYSKSEVNSLISSISTLKLQVVQTLPTQDISTNTIYLVPKTTSETNNSYDEYIYVNNTWELIGNTQINLTGYATETWVNLQIADFLTATEIESLIASSISDYSLHEINSSIGSEKTYSLVKDGQDIGDKIEIIQDLNIPDIIGKFSLSGKILNGGSGYSIGENIIATVNSNCTMDFKVMNVDNNGAVTELIGCFDDIDSAKYIGKFDYNQFSVTLDDNDLESVEGSGLSITLQIDKNSRNYYRGLGFKYYKSLKILSKGSGYAVGDYVWANSIKSSSLNPNFNMAFKVASVDNDGGVLTLNLMPTGTNLIRPYSTLSASSYHTISPTYTTGNGTGLQVELIPEKKLNSTYMHEKEDTENKVKTISNNSTDTEYPSAKCVYTQLNSKENISNKVTSISSNSTDTQYPSAKCVYDLVGDIETILAEITTGGGVE